LSGMLDYARNILLIKLGITVREISTTFLEKMQEIAKSFAEEHLLYLMNLLVKMKNDIKTSSNPLLIAEMNFIKLTKLEGMTSIDNLLKQLENNPTPNLTQQVQNQPTQNYSSPKQSPVSTPKIDQSQQDKPAIQLPKQEFKNTKLNRDLLNQEFKHIKAKMLKDKPFLANYLVTCKLESIRNNFVHFYTDTKVAYTRLEADKEYLSELFSQHFSAKIKVDFTHKAAKKKKVIARPTFDQIKENSPDLAKFIEITETDIV